MAVHATDRATLVPFLRQDPLKNATVIHRMFHHPDFTFAFADALPEPKAVLALAPSDSADRPHQFALHAVDAEASRRVIGAVPPGFCVYHIADEIAFAPVRERLRVGWWGDAVYFAMKPEDFHDAQDHEVQRLRPEHAERIARIWAPEWPASRYVRSRIEDGPSAAIYEGEELVAWYLTHLETDDVVMLGFLHVLEAHRRKGYARSLSYAMIRQVLAKGKTPACHVYTDNEPSIRLMESLGFRRVCIQAWGDGISPG